MAGLHGMMIYSLAFFCKLNLYGGMEVVILSGRGGAWKGWTTTVGIE